MPEKIGTPQKDGPYGEGSDTCEASDRDARIGVSEAIGEPCPVPIGIARSSWGTDRFSYGAYSHIRPGACPDDADALGGPVGGRVLFAGEHTQSARLAYADGAMSSGIREAKRLLRTTAVHLG
jgi:polyamine oxidase